MKKFCFVSMLLIFFISFSANAQNSFNDIKVGETLIIQDSEQYQYSHIDFPRPNFIIKTGGIADYKKLVGTRVVVTRIETEGEETRVSLKRKDGKKFFGSFALVSANLEKAITSGELKR
ncbi:hypothetical protein [Gramella sp. KN1008]|uniref:hypothetical protein n=1 Tax=Gramella sp. KN1008 TaxID=2529298 RepID=UPI00103DBF67|nr:hypothetical protein [Gramella sp. KN1008]TBW28978.1 hypothetical protein EZJ28_03595 [Gramella sp. KN1008]